MTARQQYRLRPRPGTWRPTRTSGMGGLRCVLCEKDAQKGWGFMDAGQALTITAFVCEDCAPTIMEGE